MLKRGKVKIRLRRSMAAFLVLLLLPFSAATLAGAEGMAPADPSDSARTTPGDISNIVQVDESNSSVTVTDAEDQTISPGDGGNYTDVRAGAKISIHWAFRLPPSNEENEEEEYYYLAGDTYTVQLPGGLTYTPGSADLYVEGEDPTEENKIGTLDLSANGTATVTFNNYVAEHSDVTGWFKADGTFKEETIENQTPVEVAFGSERITITPAEPSAVDLGLTKDGSYENGKITWRVTVDPNEQSVSGVSLVDEYDDNQTYAGSFTVNGTPVDDEDLNFDGHKITYNFPDEIDSTQIITYQTTPNAFGDETGMDEASEHSSFGNTATLYVNNEQNGGPVTATVDLDWIGKSAGQYDSEHHTITWTVRVGIDGQTITGAQISDTLPDGLDIASVRWNDNPVARDTGSPASPAEGKFGYDSSTRDLIYNVGDLNGRGTLTYTTTVMNPDADLNNNGEIQYSNTAFLTWDESGEPGPSDKTTGTVGSGGLISKSGGNKTDFDGSSPVIHWTITVNRNGISMPAGTAISDTIPSGQKFLPDTFKVDDTLVGADNFTHTDNSFSYTFTESFQNKRTIKYETQVTDLSSLYTNGEVSFTNDAMLDKGGTSYPASGAQKFDSQVVAKSVPEDGGYDYSTHEMTWKIVVNRNKLPMTNATVTDTLPLGMKLLADTIAVSPSRTGAGDVIVPTVNDDGNLTNSDSFTYMFSDEITDTYTITFRTELKDAALKEQFTGKDGTAAGGTDFTNRAQVVCDEKSVPVTATATENIKNPIVTKNGAYTAGNDYIDWTVEVNKAGLALDGGITLTDDLQEELRLDSGSVRIYSATVNPDGSLTADPVPLSDSAYTVAYDTDPEHPNRLTIELSGPASGAYVLQFTTDVIEDQVTVDNTIQMEGYASGTISSPAAQQVSVDSLSGGGGGGIGSISILKTDEDGVTPLTGAKFVLLDVKGVEIPGKETTTDSNGSAGFTGLLFHTFYIQETEPPAGCLLDPTPIKVRLSGSQPTYSYAAVNHKALGDISFQKKSTGGALLSGGTFNLTGTDFAGQSVRRTAHSVGGTVAFEDVPLGNYEIRETSAPAGYVRSDTVLTAGAAYNGDKTGVVTTVEGVTSPDYVLTNARRSGGGGGGGNPGVPGGGAYSITVTKTDEAGKPLAGAEFTLYGPTGAVLAKAVSNEQGMAVFDLLEEGAYTVRETKAPEGYELNTQSIGALLNDTTVNAFTVADKAKTVSPGSITVKKTDPNGNALAGAEITLYDAGGKAVRKLKSGADGLAVFEGLAPGKYSLRETAAPKGFSLYEEPLGIALASGQQYSCTLRDQPENGRAEDVGWEETPGVGPKPGGSLPKTGGFPWEAVLLAAGALLIFAGAAVHRPFGKHFAGQKRTGFLSGGR